MASCFLIELVIIAQADAKGKIRFFRSGGFPKSQLGCEDRWKLAKRRFRPARLEGTTRRMLWAHELPWFDHAVALRYIGVDLADVFLTSESDQALAA